MLMRWKEIIMTTKKKKFTELDVIQELYYSKIFDKNNAFDAVHKLIEIIERTLAKGEEIKIAKFGKFFVREEKEHKARNFSSDEQIMLPKRRVVVFKYSRNLRDKINGKLLKGD